MIMLMVAMVRIMVTNDHGFHRDMLMASVMMTVEVNMGIITKTIAHTGAGKKYRCLISTVTMTVFKTSFL